LLSKQKSKKRRNSITSLRQYIVYAQYVASRTNSYICFYSFARKYKKYCSLCFLKEQQKYRDLLLLLYKKTKRARKILFNI